jgi:hypothetical protein
VEHYGKVVLPLFLSRERPAAISAFGEIFAIEGRIINFSYRLL